MKSSLCILCLAAVLQVAVLQERIIDSCSTKQCPGRQTCIEKVKGCPSDIPNCGIRQVEAVCVVIEMSLVPSSCNDIVCAQNSNCIALQTANGTKAECRDAPMSCKEIECDDGMQCVERVKPQCVPIRTEMQPSDCSQLECPEGLICMILDGAMCAKPPAPTSCEELDCSPDLTCKMIRGIRRAKCIQEDTAKSPTNQQKVSISRDCNELECEDGYKCKLVINRKVNGNMVPMATCIPIKCPIRRRPRPPMSCAEIECCDDEVCMVCGKGFYTRARCIQTENATKQDTVVQSNDSDISTFRRPPISCNELICGPLEVEKCQEISIDNGGKQIAVCIPNAAPEKCEAVQCDNETETCLEVENDTVKMAVCIPTRINTTTSGGVGPQSVRNSQPRIRGNKQLSTPAKRCDQLNCGRDSECLQVMKNGKKRAMCMKLRKNDKCVLTPEDGEGEVTDSNSTVRQNLPDTCLERRCCEGEACIIQGTGEDGSPLAVCTPKSSNGGQPPQVQQPLTCEELMCEEGSDCIMMKQEGGGSRRAICKRRSVQLDDSDSSKRPSSERGGSIDRPRPLTTSGGRRRNGN